VQKLESASSSSDEGEYEYEAKNNGMNQGAFQELTSRNNCEVAHTNGNDNGMIAIAGGKVRSLPNLNSELCGCPTFCLHQVCFWGEQKTNAHVNDVNGHHKVNKLDVLALRSRKSVCVVTSDYLLLHQVFVHVNSGPSYEFLFSFLVSTFCHSLTYELTVLFHWDFSSFLKFHILIFYSFFV